VHVSFDLDGTLICPGKPVEPLAWPLRLPARERLRLGTRELFFRLGKNGIVPSIYTTSLRSPASVRLLFRLHGLRVDRIITALHHGEKLARRGGGYAKVPDEYGFTVHIDDAPVCPPGSAMASSILLVEEGPAWHEKLWEQLRPPV
jgi:hypothetical protein